MEFSKEFEAIETKAPDTKGDIKWYGKEQQTDFADLHDKGYGDKVLIRLFEFKLRPDLRKLPTKEQLITPDYLRVVDAELWGDGLRRVMEPRVKVDKEWARIFVPCVPSAGNSVLEETKLIQEI